MSTPPLLKPLTPFLTHAQQLQNADPLMAYYCKYYFVQEGIKMRSSAPSDNEVKKFLLMMMDQLEEHKKTLGTLDELEGEVHVKDFATHVFDLADEEDRNGAANKNTAMNFYAAAQFFDVLKLFNGGELSADVLAKQKYAKWKAANINSCLKKGITPKPGPPTQDNEEQPNSTVPPQNQPQVPQFSDTSSQFQTFPSTPNVPSVPTMPSMPKTDLHSANTPHVSNIPVTPTASNPPTTRQTPPIVTPPVQHTPTSTSFTPSYQDVELATKHAKFAVSSLQFEDVPSAVKFLKLALKNLTNTEY